MFTQLLKRIATALDTARLPYMIFGGQAVLLYGEPRLTRDIDITLGVTPDGLTTLLTVIDELRLKVIATDVEAFARETWVVPALEVESGIRVDFVFSLSAFEREAIERSQIVSIDGVGVRFIALDDLLVVKTLAGRPRDLEDMLCVLRKHPEADREYVKRWLQQFDAELGTQACCVFDETITKLS